VCLALTSCQPAPSGPPPTEPPLPGSLKTAVLPIAEEPPGFNAYLSDTGYEELLGELVYDGLTGIAPDGTYYAQLARQLPTRLNGGISPDGLTVTWKLRDHIMWSDGEPFTSDDVLFTYEALHHPSNRLAHGTGVDLIDSVETPDDYTVILHYREPSANIWGQFGGRGVGIFPRHACGDPGWMAGWQCNTQPIGTGPFVLQSWEEGKQLVFARNPRYWQTGRPFLDRIVFPIVDDDVLRSDLLRDGDADINLWVTAAQLKVLQKVAGVRLITLPSRWLLRIAFNLSQPPANSDKPTATATPATAAPHFVLADPRVRQALDMAIDRQSLIKDAFGGQGQVATNELYRGWINCPNISETPYNPEGARTLLAEAGWLPGKKGILTAQGTPYAPDGTRLALRLVANDAWDALAKAQQLVAKMWKGIGVQVTTDLAGPGDLWGDWQEGGLEVRGQFEADLWDDGYPGADPTDYLIWRYASWSIPSMADGGRGGNVMRFVNPQVDQLLQQALTQVDPLERRPTLCQVAGILAEQRPMLYLIYFSETYAFSPHLQGVVVNPHDAITWDAFNWQVE
jgi:peptide/nickel transport system substrate-binding protein